MRSIYRFVLKLLRPRLRQALSLILPKSLRHRLFRKMVRVTDTPPEGVTFKIAETVEELSQAFQLLHDAYVRMGYMSPHPSGMRITKYHILPSTTTLIAVKDGEVIATVSLVRSGVFGLPSESAYDLSFLKRRRARLAEYSALVVDQRFSHQKGKILFPLLKYSREYANRYFGVDYFILVVVPKWIDFYEGLIFFQRLPGGKRRYSTAENVSVTTIGAYLGLDEMKIRFKETYDGLPSDRNAYRYIFDLSFGSFQYPNRHYGSIDDPVMTPAMLDYFFRQVSDVFNQLTDREKGLLHQIYSSKDYRFVLPRVNPEKVTSIYRKEKRFDTEFSGQLEVPGEAPVDISVKSVSRSGLGALIHRALSPDQTYCLDADIGRRETARIEVRLAWRSEDGASGLVITNGCEEWFRFIDSLEQSVLKAA